MQKAQQSEFSDFDNIFEDKKPLEIHEEDLDMASNFLNSLGENLMEEDILEFL